MTTRALTLDGLPNCLLEDVITTFLDVADISRLRVCTTMRQLLFEPLLFIRKKTKELALPVKHMSYHEKWSCSLEQVVIRGRTYKSLPSKYYVHTHNEMT